MQTKKKKPNPVEVLSEGLTTLEERRRLAEELASKEWKQSEIDELEALLIDQDDAAERLAILRREVDRAKAEDRYFDDVSPWFGNVLEKVKPGIWVSRQTDLILIHNLVRYLDQRERQQLAADYERSKWPGNRSQEWETKPIMGLGRNRDGELESVPDRTVNVPINPFKWGDAGSAFMRWIRKNGAISREHWHGVLVREALPDWHPLRSMPPNWSQSSGPMMPNRFLQPDELAGLSYGPGTMQRERWAVWEEIHRIGLAVFRKEPKAYFEIDFLPGFSWEPIDLRTFDTAQRTRYRQQTAEARQWLDTKADAVLREIMSEEEVAAEAAINRRMKAMGYSSGRPKRRRGGGQ